MNAMNTIQRASSALIAMLWRRQGQLCVAGADVASCDTPSPSRWAQYAARFHTPHKHAALIAEYAKDAQSCNRPWELWEINMQSSKTGWRKCKQRDMSFYQHRQYRRIASKTKAAASSFQP